VSQAAAARAGPVRGALRRFTALAFVVGIGLLVLVFVAIPLRYVADRPTFSQTFSPIHGAFFILYLVTVADLGRRVGWSVRRIALVMLAGTVPFLSFVVERRMSRQVLAATGV
jgi:integral membrane protein